MGFLQCGGGQTRVKARMDGVGTARLVLCFQDGERRERELTLDGTEQTWPSAGSGVPACAYVACGARMLLMTGEDARRAFRRDAAREINGAQGQGLRAAMQIHKTNAEENTAIEAPQGGPHDGGTPMPQSNERAKPALARKTEIMKSGWLSPQRRWPPPVCAPHARYIQGIWTDEA